MRTTIALVVCIICLCSIGNGQEAQPQRVGLGAGLGPFTLIMVGSTPLSVTPVVFTVPIIINEGTRFEPELGIFSFSTESSSSQTKHSYSFYRLGAGLQFRLSQHENTMVYVGPRVGLFLQSDEETSPTYPSGTTTTKESETDFFIAVVFGGEQSLSSYFRLFGEIHLNYLSYGKTERTPAPSTPSDRSQSAIFSNFVIGVRFFF